MFGKIKSTLYGIAALINIIIIAAMIITGYGGYASPVSHSYIAVSTLSFPIFLVFNIIFCMFWMIFKFKFLLIPLTGFIICYQPIRTYSPINNASEPTPDAIKFISYNICAFREYDFAEGEENPTITYLENCDADIICLQEAIHGERINKLIERKLSRLYPYQEFCLKKGNGVAIMSRFPIISSDSINYASNSNLSYAWKLNIEGDTVLVINNHLESNKLSSDDRKKFKDLVKQHVHDKQAEEDSKLLFKKLAEASEIRAPQADSIAKYIENNKRYSIIACGDFNDSPLSYARRTIGRKLNDCFIEAGSGPGISYHTGGFYVRIDNILCSNDWDIIKCEIDRKIATSDHYPICSWIKKRSKSVKNNN